MNDFVTVSVCMITYNQELFVAQSIEGIINQVGKFKLELIIGEDCSTDNTRNICISFKEKYPELITLHLPEKNIGAQQNFMNVYKSCTGKYIAICEGDDYWTDPHKLQKQIDFMEANPDFSIVYHRVNELFMNTGEIKVETLNKLTEEHTFTIQDLAVDNIMHTVSVLFRNNNLIIPERFYTLPVGDYPLHMLNARYGKIKYMPDIMAVYRRSENSSWSMQPPVRIFRNWLIMLFFLFEEFRKEDVYKILYNQFIEKFKIYYSVCLEAREWGKLDEITVKSLSEVEGFSNWWFNNIYLSEVRLNRNNTVINLKKFAKKIFH